MVKARAGPLASWSPLAHDTRTHDIVEPRKNPAQVGIALTSDGILRRARERLAPYKVPHDVAFQDSLPKSPIMKVLRRELLERELARTPPGAPT